MNFEEYQRQLELISKLKNEPLNEQYSNCCMGLAGETGEVCDLFKKVLYHGYELDIDKVQGEIGDVLFYVSSLASSLNLSLEDIALKNVEKLRKRYPKGFSKEASINRNQIVKGESND